MSDHLVTGSGPIGPAGFLDAVTSAIRAPSAVLWDQPTVTATYRYLPDLTAAETTTFGDILATFRTHDVELSPAEYQSIKADIAGLRTYAGIASPTLAQTVSAVKAQSRILRALLRDG